MQTDNENIIVYPPNKVLERNLCYSEAPIIHQSLMFIDFNSKRESIVGSSSINKTLWQGTTFMFQSRQDVEELKWSGYYIGPTACDAKYLDDTTVVLAEDTGDVQILNIDETSNIYSNLFLRHFSRVPQIAVWSKSSKILTCSEETIMVFDANSSRKVKEVYPNYHTESIYSVDSLKYNEHSFVSCGADRKALIWDKRDVDIASVLYTNEFAALTSVAWNQSNENFIVCGTEGGDIYLLDRREPNTFVEVYHCFKNSIHRLTFNPDSNQVAVCGDTNQIIVLDSDQQSLKNVYNSRDHKGMVRGLCWSDDILYSCGFDTRVCKHIL